MKVAIGILLIVIGALTWWLMSERATNGQQRKQLEQLTARLADKSRLENLQLQEKCAEQAKKVFHALGYKNIQQNGIDVDVYRSHYNEKIGKCFMAIESTNVTTTPGTMFINKILLDAYEQREYAEYSWISRKDKKYWEVPPTICKLIASSTSEQFCKSDDEYKAFVASYLE
jgi:hypothetical protein